MHIILLQTWAVALNANVWTSFQHDSLVSRANIPQFLIGIYRTYSYAFIKYSLPIPPWCFLPSFFLLMASPARQIILSAENAWQVNSLLEMFEMMLCWTLKFLQSLHNSRTRMIATVQLCRELHAVTAVDWLERQMHAHKNNYCYSVFIH